MRLSNSPNEPHTPLRDITMYPATIIISEAARAYDIEQLPAGPSPTTVTQDENHDDRGGTARGASAPTAISRTQHRLLGDQDPGLLPPASRLTTDRYRSQQDPRLETTRTEF